MSLEIEIAELRKAIVELTAVVTNNNIGAASSEVVKGASAEKAAAKPKATKGTSAKKEEPVVEDDGLELDGLNDDIPEDDGLGLDDEPETVAVTKDDLKAEFQKLAKKSGGRETVQGILKKYKATSFNDLKESDFGAAFADVQKALK